MSSPRCRTPHWRRAPTCAPWAGARPGSRRRRFSGRRRRERLDLHPGRAGSRAGGCGRARRAFDRDCARRGRDDRSCGDRRSLARDPDDRAGGRGAPRGCRRNARRRGRRRGRGGGRCLGRAAGARGVGLARTRARAHERRADSEARGHSRRPRRPCPRERGSPRRGRRRPPAGAEGAGLIRTELAFLDAHGWPTRAEHARMLRPLLAALGGLTATVRVLDFGGDKIPPFLREEPRRGIELLLAHPGAFRAQLAAIAATAEEGDRRPSGSPPARARSRGCPPHQGNAARGRPRHPARRDDRAPGGRRDGARDRRRV